jgi:Uma2 family endonuclease
MAMTATLALAETEPKEFRFTRSAYYRMAKLGLFANKRVELIDGKVVQMPPMGNRHEVAIGLAARVLMKTFGDEFWVRQQLTLDLEPRSVPEPDIAIVRGQIASFVSKPKTALLVVEVSDSTLRYDRGYKQRLYASNAVPEYWIVNLQDNVLEVYREAKPNPHEGLTHQYDHVTSLDATGSIAPLVLPRTTIRVSQLIPPGNVEG